MDKNTRIVVSAVMILLFSGISFIFLDTTITGKLTEQFNQVKTVEGKFINSCWDDNPKVRESSIEKSDRYITINCQNQQRAANKFCEFKGYDKAVDGGFEIEEDKKSDGTFFYPNGDFCNDKLECKENYFKKITCESSTGGSSVRNQELLAREEFEDRDTKTESDKGFLSNLFSLRGEQTISDIEKELTDLRTEKDSLQVQISSAEREIETNKNDERRYAIQERRAEDEEKTKRIELVRKEEEIKKKETEIKVKDGEIKNVQAQLTKAKRNLEEKSRLRTGFENQKILLQSKIDKNRADVNSKATEARRLQLLKQQRRLTPSEESSLSRLTKEIGSLNSAYQLLDRQKKSLDQRIDQLKQEERLAGAEKARREREFEEKNNLFETVKSDLTRLQNEKNQKIEEVREIRRLKENFKEQKNLAKQTYTRKEQELIEINKRLKKVIENIRTKEDELNVKQRELGEKEDDSKNFLIFKLKDINKDNPIIEGPYQIINGELKKIENKETPNDNKAKEIQKIIAALEGHKEFLNLRLSSIETYNLNQKEKEVEILILNDEKERTEEILKDLRKQIRTSDISGDNNFLVFRYDEKTGDIKLFRFINGNFEEVNINEIESSGDKKEDYIVLGIDPDNDQEVKLFNVVNGKLEEIKVEENNGNIFVNVEKDGGGKFCLCESEVTHTISESRDNLDYFIAGNIIGSLEEMDKITSGQDYKTVYNKEDEDNFNIKVGKEAIKSMTETVTWLPNDNLHQIILEAKYKTLGAGKTQSTQVLRTITGSKTLFQYIPRDKKCFQRIDCVSKCSDVYSKSLQTGMKEVTNLESIRKMFKSTASHSPDWKLVDYQCKAIEEGTSAATTS